MEIQKAIDLLEKSEHIALLLPPEPNLDCLTAAEVLGRTLTNVGKRVGFLNLPTPEKIPGAQLLRTVATRPSLPKEFIVSLDTSASPISQLRYETVENRLNIIISPKSSSIKSDSLSLREGKILCDCIIALGIRDLTDMEIGPETGPEFITEVPIINIDVSDHNKTYGEVNLVDRQKSSCAEVVYSLVTSLKEGPLDADLATVLLAGVVAETLGFTSPATNADTLLASSELMRLGARREEAFKLAQGPQSLTFLQLFGRAAVRSRLDEKGQVLWSFVTAEDLEKTGRSGTDMPLLLGQLEKTFPPHNLSALLWQEPQTKTVQAMLAGEEQALEAVRSQEGGDFQSPYLKLPRGFASFREGEEYIASLLDAVLSHTMK